MLHRFGYRGLYDRRAVDAFAKQAYEEAYKKQEDKYKNGAARLYDEDGTFARDTVHGVLTSLFPQRGILVPGADYGTPSLTRQRIRERRQAGGLTKSDIGNLMYSLR